MSAGDHEEPGGGVAGADGDGECVEQAGAHERRGAVGVQVEDGGVGHGGVDGAAVGKGEHGSGQTGSLLRVVDSFERRFEVLVDRLGVVVVDGVTESFELGRRAAWGGAA